MKLANICKACKNAFSKARGWIRNDGILHLCCSAIIMSLLGWVRPLVFGVLAALVVVCSKEMVEFYQAKVTVPNYDWNDALHDVICDCIGLFIGLVIVWINILAA